MDVAQAIFARLQPWIPLEVAGRRAIGCNPNIRLYRYEVGQRFGPHIDQANRLGGGAVTEFTVLLYLNDDGLEGGETIFHGIEAAEGDASTLRVGAACRRRARPRAWHAMPHARGRRGDGWRQILAANGRSLRVTTLK